MRIVIQEAKVIAVEGKEEVEFFSAMMVYLGLTGIQVLDYGGKDQLRPFLKALKATTGFARVASLGVVRDANANAANAFQSVRDALQDAGLPIPTQMLVATGASPQVTVMILPDGTSSGMLEDLCLASVARNPAMTCVEQYFQCVQMQIGSLPSNMSKAKVHIFLASKPDPDLRLGEAAQAGYWPWDDPAFDHVKQFLSSL